jgi:hypothetical protein
MSIITKHVKKVFYAEVILNAISILTIVFASDTFIKGFGITTPPPLLREAFLWFATLLFVMTYIMARALFSGNDQALHFVLEGYLIGDLIYIVVQIMFVNAIGAGWTATSIFGVVVTIVLIIARIIYLVSRQPKRTNTA